HGLNTSPRTALGLAQATLMAYGGGLAHGDLYLLAGAAIVALALLGLVLSRQWAAGSLAFLLWLLPLGLVIGLAFRSGLFEIRYLVVGSPGLILLAGLGIARLARQRILAVSLTAVAMLTAAFAL